MERNYQIDSLKTLCALLVVFLHTCRVGREFIVPITRCAVPCFLIISGFLLYNSDASFFCKRLVKNCKSVAIILLWSTALYAFKQFICFVCLDSEISIDETAILKFVILNENPFGYHLWYLSAYLYALFIVIILSKICRVSWWLAFLAPILLLTDLVFGKYSLALLGWQPSFLYVRNFLCVAVPYFAIGLFMRKYWVCINRVGKLRVSAIVLIVVFCLTTLAEKYVLVNSGLNASRDHYLSTSFLAVSLFLAFVSSHSTTSNLWSGIGRKDSLYIYILHPLLVPLLSCVSVYLPLCVRNIYHFCFPVIVFVTTFVMIRISRWLMLFLNKLSIYVALVRYL